MTKSDPTGDVSDSQPSVPQQAWSCDVQVIRQRLDEDAERLFTTDVDEVEVWTTNSDSPLTCYILSDDVSDKLEEIWKAPKEDSFYILRQSHSWSRLRLTREMFETLIGHYSVFPYFLESVHAFGVRTRDDGDTSNHFHQRRSFHQQTSTTLETSYVVRFFEENKRGRGDPWSLRQTGFYQRTNLKTQQSVYIITQPSAYIQSKIKQRLGQAPINGACWDARHLILHVTVLSASMMNWKAYTESLTTQLERLEEKATFSQIDHHDPLDYVLGFSDRQSLQILRRKILKATALLESSLYTVSAVRKLCNDRDLVKDKCLRWTLIEEVDDLRAEAAYHRRTMEYLLQRSTGIGDLITESLQFRAGASMLRTSTTNVESLSNLIKIAKQGEIDEALARKTSINTASLAFVATVYLPATLLSGIFSSNLVMAEGGHFTIAAEFWKFVVILIPMTVITFGIMKSSQSFWAWSHQKHAKTAAEKNKNGDV